MMSKSDFVEKKIVIVNSLKSEKLSFSNDNILVKDEDEVTLHQSSCHNLLAVYVIGNFTITSILIDKAKKYGFSFFVLSPNLRTKCSILNGLDGNTLLHRKQYGYAGSEIGQRIILNKVQNQKNLLKKERQKDELLNLTISNLDKCIDALSCSELDRPKIMAVEGFAAKQFFACYYQKLDWDGRRPRAKNDPINTSLDIGYSMLFNYVDAIMKMYDFDSYVGVLHTEFYKRKSLVCDMMEPFRCMIDEATRKSFNYKTFSSDDFEVINNRYNLRHVADSKYQRMYLSTLVEHKTDFFEYIQSYYRWFMKGKDLKEFPVFIYDDH
jgi:CRISPR-associated protein Cas1